MIAISSLALALMAQDFAWPRLEVRPIRSGPPIGTEDGPELTLFSRVSGAIRLDDGRVLVADFGNARVVMFARSGKPLWSSGRRGDGPGEYRALLSATRCANGPLAAFDARTGRVTLLSDSGTLIDSRVLPGGQRGRMVWCEGAADRAVLWRQDIVLPTAGGYFRMPLVMIRTGRDDRIDTLSVGYNEWISTRLGRGSNNFEAPLGRPVFVAASGGTAWLCLAREGWCSSHNLSTGARDSFTVAIPQQRLSYAAWSREVHDSTDRPAPHSNDPTVSTNAMMAGLRKPEGFPKFARIQADAAGRLWLQTYEGYGSPSRIWLVVSAGGTPVARVVLPAEVRPLQIGRDYLVGVAMNDDGVEQVLSFSFKAFP